MEYLFTNTSVCFIASIAVTVFAVLLSCIFDNNLFRKKDSEIRTKKSSLTNKDVDVQLTKKKPLMLAKEIRESLPKEIQAMERRVQQQQLAAIYELMQRETADDLTMEEMQEQMKLYGY